MNWKKCIDILHLAASSVTIGQAVILLIASAAGTGVAFFFGFIVSGAGLLILGIALAVLTIFFIVSSSKVRKSHCIADEISVYSKNITKHLQHASFEIDRNTKERFTNQVVNAEDADDVEQVSEKYRSDVANFLKDCIQQVNDLLYDSVQKIVKQQFNVDESFRVIFKLVTDVGDSDDPMFWKVENFARDSRSMRDDAPKIGTKNAGVLASYSILPSVIGEDSRHYFACNDVAKLAEVGAYNNGLNSDWNMRYNAKMLVPVWNKDEFEIYGFLSIDCLNKNTHKIFLNDEAAPSEYILDLLEQAADSLFILLFLVRDLIKELDRERESALKRIFRKQYQAGNREQYIADEISVYSKKIMRHLQHASFEIDRNTKKRFTNQVVNAEDIYDVEQASEKYRSDVANFLKDCIQQVNDLLYDSVQKIVKQQFNVDESFRVIFKLVTDVGDSDDPMFWKVENFARDSRSMRDDAPKIGTKNAGVLASYSILPSVIGEDSRHYFACNDVAKLAEVGAYNNGLNSDWNMRYNAKMLVPVWNKDEFEIYGFLSIDCLNKNTHKIFLNDEAAPSEYILDLLEQAADSLFILLFLVRDLIKELDQERESALKRIQAGRMNTREPI